MTIDKAYLLSLLDKTQTILILSHIFQIASSQQCERANPGGNEENLGKFITKLGKFGYFVTILHNVLSTELLRQTYRHHRGLRANAL